MAAQHALARSGAGILVGSAAGSRSSRLRIICKTSGLNGIKQWLELTSNDSTFGPLSRQLVHATTSSRLE